ncbi:MAG: hypothetical protein WKF71_11360 [Pyrinomonadaceae bacterium]
MQVEGFKQKVVRFTTDIPHLTNWGQPLLARRGFDSRRAYERRICFEAKIWKTAVGLYVNLVKKLLAGEIT